jgi:hypothetical protein
VPQPVSDAATAINAIAIIIDFTAEGPTII